MWILGGWGQSKTWWSRSSGVKMTKGENGVYTGVLTLPKGTEFDLKIMKSTVDGTSGGDNVWSAVRYTSVLNSDSRHDFGEFADNLVPNSDFEEGAVKWTPSSCILERGYALSSSHCLVPASGNSKATSDTFVIPPNQTLKYATYFLTWDTNAVASIKIEDVNTHSTLVDASVVPQATEKWMPFVESFKSGDVPVTARIILTSKEAIAFDDMWIGS